MASVAIVGRSCLLPGASSPAELWDILNSDQDVLKDLATRTGEPFADAPHMVGGYVSGFDEKFDPSGFFIPEQEVRNTETINKWVLHTARESLKDAGMYQPGLQQNRTALILGNLSLPTSGFSNYCRSVWEGMPQDRSSGARFMSGRPALMAGKALGLGGVAFSLDAACASSLYAISYACDLLENQDADVVLAGAVNAADQYFLHAGFHKLMALSPEGKSRPLQANGDGLIPSEGAAFITLMRTEDALRQGWNILGIVKGTGLSNDGRSQGFLSPSADGQVRAMKEACTSAGLSPSDISYLECHATGTPVGDRTEAMACLEHFGPGSGLRVGSLKGHFGHLITASGMAAVIKVLEIFRHREIPPVLYKSKPLPELAKSGLKLTGKRSSWDESDRFAAVSSFGFGGNNGHVILGMPPEPREFSESGKHLRFSEPEGVMAEDLAVIGLELKSGTVESPGDYAEVVLSGGLPGKTAESVKKIRLPVSGLGSPPNDLKEALPQQTLMLELFNRLFSGIKKVPGLRTGVFAGMETHPDAARYGMKWHWQRTGPEYQLNAQKVLGSLPNIVANRINRVAGLCGASTTCSSESMSGLRALDMASAQLRSGRLDLALVGAVDFTREPVHRAATGLPGQDGGVVLALKRYDEAVADGETILGLLSRDASRGAPVEERAAGALPESGAASGLFELVKFICRKGRKVKKEQDTQYQFRAVSYWGQEWKTGFTPLERIPEFRADRQIKGDSIALPGQLPWPDRESSAAVTSEDTGFYVMEPAPCLPEADSEQALTKKLYSGTGEPVAGLKEKVPVPEQLQGSEEAAEDRNDDSGITGFYERNFIVHQKFMEAQTKSHREFLESRTRGFRSLMDMMAFVDQQPELFRNGRETEDKSGSAPVAWQEPVAGQQAGDAEPRQFPHSDASPAEQGSLTPEKPDLVPLQEFRNDKKPEPFSGADSGVDRCGPSGLDQGESFLVQGAGTGERKTSREHPDPLPPRIKTLSREQLIMHSSGRISEVFGDYFGALNTFSRVVRMPEPPLLLADRVTDLKAAAGSMGTGSVFTETDVLPDEIYMHQGRFVPGLLVEAGQADLLLISWLGVDFINRGERVYRLLGCELTYHGDLPRAGQTLSYAIHLDSHVEHGDSRLFFFHSDCKDKDSDKLILSVRNGQAGFFTDEELHDARGLTWNPDENRERFVHAPLVHPEEPCQLNTFDEDQVTAFSERQAFDCFGRGFESCASHTMSPGIPGGSMLLFHRVSHCSGPDAESGQRGRMTAELDISPESWFFEGHFKDDPCMPGTLMLDGCFQAMSFYMAWLGLTMSRDGWRFQPACERKFRLKCRGQLTPASKKLTYEIFVRESHDAGAVRLVADVLCKVDGLNAFLAQELALDLVPDWPLGLPGEEGRAKCREESLLLTKDLLMASAVGKPSAAFGAAYMPFDTGRRVARLPAPPFQFVTDIGKYSGTLFKMETGCSLEVEFRCEPGDWFLKESGWNELPMVVLMEMALQGCGILASLAGSALSTSQELFFRNLDGRGRIYRPLNPDKEPVRTKITLKKIANITDMTIEGFSIECFSGETKVCSFSSEFGFFPGEALQKQAGLPELPETEKYLTGVSGFYVDLKSRPPEFFRTGLSMPDSRLLMIDRVTGFWPGEGRAGLGVLRGEKDILPSDWYFKAHFFQDPVQPGSLGIEAMVQLIQFYVIHSGVCSGFRDPAWSLVSEHQDVSWKYRGQVRPEDGIVTVVVNLCGITRTSDSVRVVGQGSLWVDGSRIYEASGLMLTVSDSSPGKQNESANGDEPGSIDAGERPESETMPEESAGNRESSYSLNNFPWLGDYRPDFSVPAMPLSVALWDAIGRVRAETGKTRKISGIRKFVVPEFVPYDGMLTLAATSSETSYPGYPTARKVAVSSGGRKVADAVVLSGNFPESGGLLPSPQSAWQPGAEFYELTAHFQGPSLRLIQEYRLGKGELSLRFSLSPGEDSFSSFVKIFEQCFQAVPFSAYREIYSGLKGNFICLPYKISALDFFKKLPESGDFCCETRLVGRLGSNNEPVFLQQLIDRSGPDQSVILAEWQVVARQMPLGLINSWTPGDRKSFMAGKYQHGLSLSRHYESETRLNADTVRDCDWFPGTVERLFGTSDPEKILLKEYQSRKEKLHPRLLPDSLPFTRFQPEVTGDGPDLVLRGEHLGEFDSRRVVSFWSGRAGHSDWLPGDILTGLLERFLRRVVCTHPDKVADLRGKNVIYLANHQVGSESLLFSAVQSCYLGRLVNVLTRTVGEGSPPDRLAQLLFSYPGQDISGQSLGFDPHNSASLEAAMAVQKGCFERRERSLLVHWNGTRVLADQALKAVLADSLWLLAETQECYLVPVKFTGGLPERKVDKKLGFPYGLGRQDIWIGEPRVLPEGIDGTAKRLAWLNSFAGDVPGAPSGNEINADEVYARKVHSWMLESGVTLDDSVLFCILRDMAERGLPVSGETQAVLDCRDGMPFASGEAGPAEQWVRMMAQKLLGRKFTG